MITCNGFYNQIKGMAIGTILALTYANLTMGFFELRFYDICQINFGDEVQTLYTKFEQIFGLLSDPPSRRQTKSRSLISLLNSVHTSIKFTMEYSKIEVPFLIF